MTNQQPQQQADSPAETDSLAQNLGQIPVTVHIASSAQQQADAELAIHTELCSIQGRLARAKLKIAALETRRGELLEALRGD